MAANLETLAAAVSPLALSSVSGGVCVKVNGVRVTLKDRGQFKVYFRGKKAEEAVSALIAANPDLAAKRLSGGVVKFEGGNTDSYPAFIDTVKKVLESGKGADDEPAKARIAPPVPTGPAPANVAAIADKAASRSKKKA